jgi:hypothetical protein
LHSCFPFALIEMAAASASSAPRESIYNWIKVETAVASKPARYRSHFNPKAGPSYSTLNVAKKAVGSIGKSVKATVDPRRYLKAGSKMGKGVLPSATTGEIDPDTGLCVVCLPCGCVGLLPAAGSCV